MAVNNSLQKTAQKKTSFTAFINSTAVQNQINSVLKGPRGQRFVTAIVSAVTNNKALQECDNGSIVSAALLGESLNLSPSPQLGHYYMVPFKDKTKGSVAQFILGYKGYIQLAIRSGYYKKINVVAIKEGELVRFNPMTEEIEVKLIEDEDLRENTPTAGYYAAFEYNNGFRKALYWSREKMINHADKYSQAFSKNATRGKYPKVSFADFEAGKYDPKDAWLYSSNWYQDFDAMAYKTMLRQLISKWGIMSIDLQQAFEADDHIISSEGTPQEAEEISIESEVVNEKPAATPQEAPASADASAALFS